MKAIDLFCGVGGATLGMLSANIEVALGVDHCPETASAYSEVTGVDALAADVGTLRPGDLPGTGEIDLVWASPPCQPYSVAGKRRGRQDERDALPDLLRFIERFRPPVIVVEEVPLFRSSNGHAALIHALMIKGGYHVSSRILNAANYGIPQARRRVFIVARLDGRPWRWPRATHCENPGLFEAERWVSLDDAVGDQVRAREPLGRLPNWITSRWQQLPVALRDNVQVSAQLTTKWDGRRNWLHVRPISQPSFTVTASMAKRHSHVVSGGQAWALTLEDAAKLQGLPIPTSKVTSTHIGNAVPPALARAVVGRLQ